MSMFPTTERIQVEIAVAMSIREQYGTNQPGKTYEDGIAEALLWVLGGQEPQNHVEPLKQSAPTIPWESSPYSAIGYSISTAGNSYWVVSTFPGHESQIRSGLTHPVKQFGFYLNPLSNLAAVYAVGALNQNLGEHHG